MKEIGLCVYGKMGLGQMEVSEVCCKIVNYIVYTRNAIYIKKMFENDMAALLLLRHTRIKCYSLKSNDCISKIVREERSAKMKKKSQCVHFGGTRLTHIHTYIIWLFVFRLAWNVYIAYIYMYIIYLFTEIKSNKSVPLSCFHLGSFNSAAAARRIKVVT